MNSNHSRPVWHSPLALTLLCGLFALNSARAEEIARYPISTITTAGITRSTPSTASSVLASAGTFYSDSTNAAGAIRTEWFIGGAAASGLVPAGAGGWSARAADPANATYGGPNTKFYFTVTPAAPINVGIISFTAGVGSALVNATVYDYEISYKRASDPDFTVVTTLTGPSVTWVSGAAVTSTASLSTDLTSVTELQGLNEAVIIRVDPISTGGNNGAASQRAGWLDDVVLNATSAVTITDRTWTGNTDNVWDTTTTNWTPGSLYNNGGFDNVIFNNSGTNRSISLGFTATPLSVTVTNTSPTNYSISGAGKISGSGGLAKSGTGTLTLATDNDYAGTTTISGGTLQIGSGGASGSVGGNIVNNATLVVNRTGTLTLAGALTGSGSTTVTGGGSLALGGSGSGGALTLDNGTLGLGTYNQTVSSITVAAAGGTISGSGTLTLGGGLTLNGNATVSPSITLGASSILWTQTGGSVLTLNAMTLKGYGPGNSSFTNAPQIKLGGAVVISQNANNNKFVFEGGFDLNGNNLTLKPRNSLGWGSPAEVPGVITGNGSIVITNDVTVANNGTYIFSGANDYTGTTTLKGQILALHNATALGTSTFTIDPAVSGNTPSTLANISGSTVTLANNNVMTWNGDFYFNNAFIGTSSSFADLNLGAGALTLGNSCTLTLSTRTLTVGGVIGDGGNAYGLTKEGNGTLVLNGVNTYTGATVVNAGTLGGSGTLAGTLTVGASGTVAPGASIGMLTVQGAATVSGAVVAEITGGPSADKIVFNGSAALSGPLTVTNVGALVNGQTYDLFDFSAAPSGTFSSVSLPGGLAHWNTTALYTSGVITFANNNPSATNFTLGVAVGGSTTATVIGKYAAATDVDGDSVVVSAVTQGTHGTVSFNGTSVTYTSTNSASSDSFTYTVSDGLGGTDTKTVNVTISSAEGFNKLSGPTPVGGGLYELNYLGVPGKNYALDETDSITPPIIWTPVATNAASGTGAITYTVPLTYYPSGFFRTRHVP